MKEVEVAHLRWTGLSVPEGEEGEQIKHTFQTTSDWCELAQQGDSWSTHITWEPNAKVWRIWREVHWPWFEPVVDEFYFDGTTFADESEAVEFASSDHWRWMNYEPTSARYRP